MGRYATPRWTAHLHCLEFPSFGDSTPDIKNDLSDGNANGNFYKARIIHLTNQGEDFGPFAHLRTYLSIPLHAILDDQGDIGPGLHVVDIGGFAVQPYFSRKWWPCPRHPSFPFNGGHKGSFFSTDEGPCTHVQGNIKIKTGSQDILP